MNVYQIGIIGLGPKGLYGLERLLAELMQRDHETPVNIHLFNRTAFFGAGDIYAPNQPPFLLMNSTNAYVNMWPEKECEPVVKKPQDFTDWLAERTKVPASLLRQEYSPRILVGSYLQDGFRNLCCHLPPNVKITPHIGEVTDLIPAPDGFHLMLKNSKGTALLPYLFGQLLITTGHAGNRRENVASKSDKNGVEFIYPVDHKLEKIRDKHPVIVQGLGLTFIDGVLALTEGRGGVFTNDPEGKLIYVRSGREPEQIYPFSRSGWPMIPRASGDDSMTGPLYYFTGESIFSGTVNEGVQLDFEQDLLPLIYQEFTFKYYQLLFRQNDLELPYEKDFSVLMEKIAEFHSGHGGEMFRINDLHQPFRVRKGYRHEQTLFYLKRMIEEAEKGIHGSPLMAAVTSWRKISELFGRLYFRGGLTPRSHELFDQYYAGFFNRIAHGPPVENMRKIMALADSGILDFTFAGDVRLKWDDDKEVYRLLDNDTAAAVEAPCFIDARIPKTSLSQQSSTLYTNMLDRGLIRPFTNRGEKNYAPGCPDLTIEGHPVDALGNVLDNITFYGTPAEGITFDNDTLSRTRNDFVSAWAERVACQWVTDKR